MNGYKFLLAFWVEQYILILELAKKICVMSSLLCSLGVIELKSCIMYAHDHVDKWHFESVQTSNNFKTNRQAQNWISKRTSNVKTVNWYYMSSTCTWWTTSGCRGISDTIGHLCEALLPGRDLGRGPTNLNGLVTGRWSQEIQKQKAS